MTNRKKQFLMAVQILAPGEASIFQAARRVNEESLPAAPGGVALEFVVAMQTSFPGWSCKHRFKPFSRGSQNPNLPAPLPEWLALEESIRIKSAEFWLKLGHPDEALREINALPQKLQNHPSVLKVRVAAIHISGHYS